MSAEKGDYETRESICRVVSKAGGDFNRTGKIQASETDGSELLKRIETKNYFPSFGVI